MIQKLKQQYDEILAPVLVSRVTVGSVAERPMTGTNATEETLRERGPESAQ